MQNFTLHVAKFYNRIVVLCPSLESLKFKIYKKVIASKSKMMWKSETSISFMIFSRNINLSNKVIGLSFRRLKNLYPKALSVCITGLIFSLSAKWKSSEATQKIVSFSSF